MFATAPDLLFFNMPNRFGVTELALLTCYD